MQKYEIQIEARIDGIPCLIGVLNYAPAIPARLSGPPEHCDPGEAEELEYDVLDLRGRPATWLDRKLDDLGRKTLERHIVASMTEEFEP